MHSSATSCARRSGFRPGCPRRPGADGVARYNVALHRTLAFGLAAFFASLAGVLYVWWQGQIAPGDVQLGSTINLLVMVIIGGLVSIEGACRRLRILVIDTYVHDLLGAGIELRGNAVRRHFNTIIGAISPGHRSSRPMA
jgi:branched-chain amino acid transport system permease protein